jgi:hypothetical protein
MAFSKRAKSVETVERCLACEADGRGNQDSREKGQKAQKGRQAQPRMNAEPGPCPSNAGASPGTVKTAHEAIKENTYRKSNFN